jgi:hypothetical protein
LNDPLAENRERSITKGGENHPPMDTQAGRRLDVSIARSLKSGTIEGFVFATWTVIICDSAVKILQG